LQLTYTLLFRIRAWGVENVPRRGSVVLVSNHQSFLDPPALGLCLPRQIHYMARASLFRLWPAGAVLRGWHAMPIERGTSDLAAIRLAIDVLRAGHGLLLFPEGTRTRDGSIGPFKPGFAMVAARARVPVMPAAIDGAFGAWPRWQRLPRPGRICVAYGEPMDPPAGGKAECVAAAEEVRRRVLALHGGLRGKL
jgi:1-acyl-sn-glycerol-3-phosphate acyltransferase